MLKLSVKSALVKTVLPQFPVWSAGVSRAGLDLDSFAGLTKITMAGQMRIWAVLPKLAEKIIVQLSRTQIKMMKTMTVWGMSAILHLSVMETLKLKHFLSVVGRK